MKNFFFSKLRNRWLLLLLSLFYFLESGSFLVYGSRYEPLKTKALDSGARAIQAGCNRLLEGLIQNTVNGHGNRVRRQAFDLHMLPLIQDALGRRLYPDVAQVLADPNLSASSVFMREIVLRVVSMAMEDWKKGEKLVHWVPILQVIAKSDLNSGPSDSLPEGVLPLDDQFRNELASRIFKEVLLPFDPSTLSVSDLDRLRLREAVLAWDAFVQYNLPSMMAEGLSNMDALVQSPYFRISPQGGLRISGPNFGPGGGPLDFNKAFLPGLLSAVSFWAAPLTRHRFFAETAYEGQLVSAFKRILANPHFNQRAFAQFQRQDHRGFFLVDPWITLSRCYHCWIKRSPEV